MQKLADVIARIDGEKKQAQTFKELFDKELVAEFVEYEAKQNAIHKRADFDEWNKTKLKAGSISDEQIKNSEGLVSPCGLSKGPETDPSSSR
jgi:hypothetical protein